MYYNLSTRRIVLWQTTWAITIGNLIDGWNSMPYAIRLSYPSSSLMIVWTVWSKSGWRVKEKKCWRFSNSFTNGRSTMPVPELIKTDNAGKKKTDAYISYFVERSKRMRLEGGMEPLHRWVECWLRTTTMCRVVFLSGGWRGRNQRMRRRVLRYQRERSGNSFPLGRNEGGSQCLTYSLKPEGWWVGERVQ